MHCRSCQGSCSTMLHDLADRQAFRLHSLTHSNHLNPSLALSPVAAGAAWHAPAICALSPASTATGDASGPMGRANRGDVRLSMHMVQ